MKKILCTLFVTIMLFGLSACNKPPAATQPTHSPNETAPLLSYSVYVPNGNADGFHTVTINTEDISAETILAELKKQNVLPDTVSIHHFQINHGLITIDFNQAFADAVCSMGTSGEVMMIGSVVNTFLDAFQAESVSFSVDDQILESGHETYDFSMTFFSFSNEYSENG